jgi:hypothetical protein
MRSYAQRDGAAKFIIVNEVLPSSRSASQKQIFLPRRIPTFTTPEACCLRCKDTEHCSRFCNQETRCESFGETEEANREKRQIRQQNKKKKGKKNKGSKKNVSSNVRIDGFENTDANV